MRFEWDPHRAQSNKRKHGITFEEAAECFADSLAMIVEDQERAGRLILIGQSQSSRLSFTVFAVKDGDAIRIISARRPTRAERRKYEAGDF